MGDALWRAVRAPSVTQEAVRKFRETAEAVQTGTKTAEAAEAELAEISTAFATILQAANKNAGALGVLIGLLALILSYYAFISSNQDSAQAHADAQAQLKATQQQTLAIETSGKGELRSERALERIHEEIERLNDLSEPQEVRQRPTSTMKYQSQAQRLATASTPTRQQRRRAEQLAKKPWRR